MDQQYSPQPVSLLALTPAPWNPRSIKDERFANLCRSLEADPEFLQLRPILATLDGTIFAGNQRFHAARQLGWKTIPTIIVDIPDEQAKAWALKDNNEWGEWDDPQLVVLLAEAQAAGQDLSLLGFDERELQQLLDSISASGTEPDLVESIELPAVPVTQPGDLHLLGQHRLLCGSATSGPDIAELMNGLKANCVWTDPPFGVSYVGGTAEHLTLANDSAEGLEGLLMAAFANMDEHLVDGAAIYVAHPSGPGSITFGQAFLRQGWRYHQTLIWAKDSLVIGHCDYQYQHEPIALCYKPGGGRHGRGARGWYGPNNASTVFDVPRPKASRDHPTMKPVELIEQMVRNSSRSGEIVLDMFLGSGSTVLACELLGRRCFGMEIDPRYCDVVVHRFEAMTGMTAERIPNGRVGT